MVTQEGVTLIQKELQPNERILWSGQPIPTVLFTKADIFLVPFTLLWFSFVLPLGGEIFSSDSPTFPFALFPLFFFVIGSYISIGRFIYKFLRKKKTYYALTDKRVIVISNFLGRHVQAAFIKEIPTINKLISSKGVGSLVFGNQNMQAAMYGNTGMELFGAFNTNPIPAFYDISDAEEVYKKVNELKNK